MIKGNILLVTEIDILSCYCKYGVNSPEDALTVFRPLQLLFSAILLFLDTFTIKLPKIMFHQNTLG